MNPRASSTFFVFFACIAFAALMYGASGLHPFGSFSGPYSAYLLTAGTLQRHIDNIATAVNFDYRGFDTMGEEYIFFTSVTAVLFMLSGFHARTKRVIEPMESPSMRPRTGALRWFPMALAAFLGAMSMDVAAHTTATPGGGFQGGALFGSALACIYLGAGYNAFASVAKREVFDALKAFGAASYVMMGVATAFATGAFLKNTLNAGQTGALVSGGLVYLINAAVFVEVASGFVVVVAVFIHQTRYMEESKE